MGRAVSPPSDQAALFEAAHAVGDRARSEVHPLPQLAPADPGVALQFVDDSSVDAVDRPCFIGHLSILYLNSVLINGFFGQMMTP